MKKLIILVLIVIAGYLTWQKITDRSSTVDPLYEQPYIVVYGRDTCGWTKHYLKKLGNSGIKHIYKNLDKAGVGDELHPRMRQAGLDTGYYLLPVIDANAEMLIRPEMKKVLAAYNGDSG
jgi:hypothetical protein